MRALWLASAALIITSGMSGMAFAQTTPPAGTSQGMSNSGMSNQGMSNQGMPNQGMSNQGMSNQGMSNQGGMSPMQQNGGDQANTYLHRAREAIRAHRRAQADNLLANAETLLLTRAVPQSAAGSPDNSPRVTAIENARAAVRQGNWTEAVQYTDQAMHHHHGMMNGMNQDNMNGGMGQGTMSPSNGSMAQPNRTTQ